MKNLKIWEEKICELKIGIIGLGFVGGAMEKSFRELGVNIQSTFDKFKNGGMGKIEDLLNCDIIFSALPTVYSEKLKEYNKVPFEETCEFLKCNNYNGLLIVKSTVEPGTSEDFSRRYGLKILHNPEFLTARTAYDDFHNQKHIVIGKTDLVSNEEHEKVREFYKYYYSNADISLCTSKESESMKIFCNCFYAVKVQFFNELFLVCKDGEMNYERVRDIMLKNGWINPMHTNVPGPDGKLSYGGLCFPKDTNALNEHMIKRGIPNKVLQATIEERDIMREDKDNCE